MKGVVRVKWFLAAAVIASAVLAVSFLIRPVPAGAQSEQTFVLMADQWGVAQDAAVAVAGGRVSFSHGQSGLGVVTSGSPGFLKRALASGAFSRGAEDMMVQWQPPTREGDVIEAAVTPGDETFINLQWNTKAVEAEAAWAAGFTGAGARVAVLDGGIWNTHVDLVGRIDLTTSTSFVPGFAFNEDTGTFWHGTHGAGIIAANDNGIGTIGIAPDATIIGVKVLHDGSGWFSWIIEGILYASTPIEEGGAGADVINMSLSAVFPRGGGNTGAGPLIAALNKAVNYAGQRTLVVSAASNDYLDLDHSGSFIVVPAQSGSGIAVSATGPVGFAVNYPNGATNFRRPASYTNYGNSLVWLAAPGGDFMYPGNELCTLPRVPSGTITNYCWVFDMVMSCARGSGSSISSYSWAAGTSMAAPAVCAVAALVKQRFPWFAVADLKTWLAKTADDEGKPGNDPYYGKGFVNARRAVTE
jgi:lantibiotic leader peptide-processing serine protease